MVALGSVIKLMAIGVRENKMNEFLVAMCAIPAGLFLWFVFLVALALAREATSGS
jgi:hypothetical protein